MPYILSVGERMPNWSKPIHEGGQFNFDVDGPVLQLFWGSPTHQEIEAFRLNTIRFGLIKAGMHTMFLLFNIEQGTLGWADASYAIGRVAPENRSEKTVTPNMGWLVKMMMIDANTGILRALRAATVTPRFSRMLDELVDGQRKALPFYTHEAHDLEIAAAHRRWKTPNDMRRDAMIAEIIGQPFPKAGL